MVLWEIALGTAYFLGLKRTYKLALKIQRRLISPKHPRVRQFVHRRIRFVFDTVLKVHHKIQQRDIEVGRNVGNWILRWLDKMKPAAQIRGGNPTSSVKSNAQKTKQLANSSHQKTPGGCPTFGARSGEPESDRHLFTSSRNILPKAFPTVAMMMRPAKLTGADNQHRHFSVSTPAAFGLKSGKFGSEGVIRKDIMQWMWQN